jgi:hypothetical protein
LPALEAGSLVGAESLLSLDVSYSGVQALSASAASNWDLVVEINATGCPLQCNCQHAWLISWLRRRNDTLPSSTTVAECYFPERLRGRDVVSVDASTELGCDTNSTAKVLMGLGCGLAVVCVAVLAFLVHHYRGCAWRSAVFDSCLGKGGSDSRPKEKDFCDSARRLENEYIIYAVPGGIRAVPITEL